MKFWKSSVIASAIIASTLFYSNTAKANDTKLYNNDYGISHYTRYDLHRLERSLNDKNVQLPNMNNINIENVNSANDYWSTQYKGEPLSIGDNWIVKDKDGQVANYHGYHLMIAMGFNAKEDPSTINGKLYLFYQKSDQYNKGANSWKLSGPLFMNNLEGVTENKNLFEDTSGEWSGSAFVQKDGNVRLFYTIFMNNNNLKQVLATSVLKIDANKNGVTVDHSGAINDRKVIFQADEKYYQSNEQVANDPNHSPTDDFALRDPQFVFNKGKTYLIFEGSAGPSSGGEGIKTVYNKANLGGNEEFQKGQLSQLFENKYNNDLRTDVAYANGVIGIIELDNHYNLKKIMKPLVSFAGVDDETERPSIIKYNNRFYLFTTMHGWHMSSNIVETGSSLMLGMSSKSLTGKYKPLNGNGLVLYEPALKSVDPYVQRLFEYSYVVNQSKTSPFIINSYTGLLSPNYGLNQYSTLAPSMLLNINGNKTTIDKKALAQGQFIYKK